MNSVVNQLRHVMKRFVMGGVRKDHGLDIVRKIKMINVISLVGITNLIPLGYLAFTKGNPWLGVFDCASALFLLANQVHLRTTGKHKWSIYSGVVCTSVLFFYLFYTGGADHPVHLWFYTFLLFSFFLLGSKKRTAAIFLLLGLSMLALSLNDGFQSMAIYSVRFQIRFVASTMVLIIFAYFFESTRKAAQEELTVKNTELEQKIVEGKVTARALKQATKTAEAANRAKSEFLANMSHELRTPLNHILGFTELVVDKNFGDLNDIQEEYLNDVLSSSKHLLSLINDILDISKVEAGKLEMEPSNCNPKLLLKNSLIMIKEKAMKHGIRLSNHIDGIPETITADERKLKQVMYNLLSNAVKFTQAGGEIRLTADLADGSLPIADSSIAKAFDQELRAKSYELKASQKFIRISVTDTGIGLKSEDLKRIFNPFKQVESSANRRFQGTGLGLSLSKSLVELHGGRIWVESEGEGKGSAFRFIIPLQV